MLLHSSRRGFLASLLLVLLITPFRAAAAPAAAAGTIQVTFLYMPPGEIEPTYHTAVWVEDQAGVIVKTLFVSQELANTEYKMGLACPDWIMQAHWEKADKALVQAVSGPTPNIGSGILEFDTAKVGLAAGTYQFKFQVHIGEKYNVLYKARVVVGGAADTPAVEELFSPSKPPGEAELVRDLKVRYIPK